ncbi:RBBP9/YdeN family alpha/beta hydrolase [Ectothiorhodospira shaposhnikovii]|uniref:RBBP9/YdeN family alpha/beta hydrolase n=1 Tax=Ectothiorhodospira shaposhnikovii TaxID=1054 RepID=UPI001EE8BD32|nr:alpha/beta hydrolase [Ectothiorhodospira shaposhnikovii]MCG5511950.1 alpha/beta hydrolase [Ectothiorhodospira shaposhnikovii]
MAHTTLIVPGFHGSEAEHWQTWMESLLPDARRVTGIDWESPVLSRWVEAVGNEITRSVEPVWLVAHSFGCLATVTAASHLSSRVAGVMLVAPADPDRFSSFGTRDPSDPAESLASRLPSRPLEFPGLVVASTNDPWMPMAKLLPWTTRWGMPVINIGNAGHINVASGFGPWPQGLDLLRTLQQQSATGVRQAG